MNDIMLDLETFGTGYNAMIIQIGACYFDRYTGEIGETFFCNVDPEDSAQYGFEKDKDTIEWWAKQTVEAQNQLTIDRISVESALCEVNNWLAEDCAIWSHATFDFVLLSNHYRVTGIKPAFKYWQAKDIRTLTNLSGISSRDYAPRGTAHNALDDCLFQVKYCVDAFNILKQENKP